MPAAHGGSGGRRRRRRLSARRGHTAAAPAAPWPASAADAYAVAASASASASGSSASSDAVSPAAVQAHQLYEPYDDVSDDPSADHIHLASDTALSTPSHAHGDLHSAHRLSLDNADHVPLTARVSSSDRGHDSPPLPGTCAVQPSLVPPWSAPTVPHTRPVGHSDHPLSPDRPGRAARFSGPPPSLGSGTLADSRSGSGSGSTKPTLSTTSAAASSSQSKSRAVQLATTPSSALPHRNSALVNIHANAGADTDVYAHVPQDRDEVHDGHFLNALPYAPHMARAGDLSDGKGCPDSSSKHWSHDSTPSYLTSITSTPPRDDTESLIVPADRDPEQGGNDHAGDEEFEGIVGSQGRVNPFVRASVPSEDDPDMPVHTLRVWLLGPAFAMGFSSLFVAFSYWGWNTSVLQSAVLVQIFCWPLGLLMSKIPYPARWPLARFVNPGPFSVKEHALICVMAAFGTGPEWPLDVLMAHKIGALRFPAHAGYKFLLMVSSTCMGQSYAGLVYRTLVLPGRMLWPTIVSTSALLTTLHRIRASNWPRRTVFYSTLGGAFAWGWVPGLLFQALQTFAWPTWCAPTSYTVNLLFGGQGGMGLWPSFSLDWTTICQALPSPLITPFFAQVNVLLGYFVFGIAFPALLTFTHTAHTQYMPWVNTIPLDRFGHTYERARITRPAASASGLGIELNLDAYASYSRPYYSATNLVQKGCVLALVPAVLVHFCLYDMMRVVCDYARPAAEEDDLHAQLIQRYPAIPAWWWATLFLFSLACAIGAAQYDTGLPIWALLLSIVLGLVFVLPAGVIAGTTAISLELTFFFALVGGYVLPGRAVGWMLFRLYPLMGLLQALQMCAQLKLGVYFKIPPRATFIASVLTTLLSSGVQIVTSDALGAPGSQAQQLIYDAVVLDLLGSRRTFGVGQGTYPSLNFFFLVGAAAPLPAWLCYRYNPLPLLLSLCGRLGNPSLRRTSGGARWSALVLTPVILTAAPVTYGWQPVSLTTWAVVGGVAHKTLHHPRMRNYYAGMAYVLSSALTSGTAAAYWLIYMLPLFMHRLGQSAPAPDWWGNSIQWAPRETQNDLTDWDLPYLFWKNTTTDAPGGAFATPPRSH